MRNITVNEFEVVEDLKNGVFKALRHGEEWKSLVGDNLVLSLIDELERVNNKLSEARNLLYDANDLLDDTNGYDTEVYRKIEEFLNGE